MAAIVAPRRIVNLAGFELGDVPERYPIEERLGIIALDEVFDHGRNVEERRLAANCEIFELFIPQRQRRLVAAPAVPILPGGQRFDAWLEWRRQTKGAEMLLPGNPQYVSGWGIGHIGVAHRLIPSPRHVVPR